MRRVNWLQEVDQGQSEKTVANQQGKIENSFEVLEYWRNGISGKIQKVDHSFFVSEGSMSSRVTPAKSTVLYSLRFLRSCRYLLIKSN